MLMNFLNSLLVLHILTGTALLLVFVGRFIGVLTKKIEPSVGRSLIGGLSIALLSSGFALVIVAKDPVTGACISSIAIIAGVVVLEYGLAFAKKKISN